MHIELTEHELIMKFVDMSSKEIVDYLLGEGLSIKPDKKDFNDVPEGIYRRVAGQDLIRKNFNNGFTWVDQRNEDGRKEKIDWTLSLGGGDWWVQVLNHSNVPVFTGYRFQVSEDGERIA